MRKSTYDYIVDVLSDYYKTEIYLKQRMEELEHPYIENDANGWIQGTRGHTEAAASLLITIDQDRRLTSLERNQKAVKDTLDESDENTKIIIEELYLKDKRKRKYTMQGLITNNLIYCSRSTAFELKKEFFKELAIKLGLGV